MLRLLADENFDSRILNGLRRGLPQVDIPRLTDVGLAGSDDPEVLAWAAQDGRILLSHDVTTITHYAYQRVREGLPMPGVIEVHPRLPIGQAIDDLLLLVTASRPGEWEGQVLYLPLR